MPLPLIGTPWRESRVCSGRRFRVSACRRSLKDNPERDPSARELIRVITQLRNLSEVVIAAVEATDRFKAFPMWWRGQSDASWHLVPSVLRRNKGPADEMALFARFHQRAPSRHARCPEAADVQSWLFLMQHYRLPTRLLDWT